LIAARNIFYNLFSLSGFVFNPKRDGRIIDVNARDNLNPERVTLRCAYGTSRSTDRKKGLLNKSNNHVLT
jgi:hypothetical protein